MVPGAVYFAWLEFSIRGALEASNAYWILGAIIVGTIASYFLANRSKMPVAVVVLYFFQGLLISQPISRLEQKGK
jgi:RsiW-degrading membrane proteinase PrsW (M82 family)